MIVLKELLVKEATKIDTEEGKTELPGGLFAEFTLTEQDGSEDVLVPISEQTYNALMEITVGNLPDSMETIGA